MNVDQFMVSMGKTSRKETMREIFDKPVSPKPPKPSASKGKAGAKGPKNNKPEKKNISPKRGHIVE